MHPFERRHSLKVRVRVDKRGRAAEGGGRDPRVVSPNAHAVAQPAPFQFARPVGNDLGYVDLSYPTQKNPHRRFVLSSGQFTDRNCAASNTLSLVPAEVGTHRTNLP